MLIEFDKGTQINNQCCNAETSDQVVNPYQKIAASCQRRAGFGFVNFTIYINGWVTDGGRRLHDEINGCVPASATGWSFEEIRSLQVDGSDANLGEYTSQYAAVFNLDLFFRDGCVGRAMISAGAPPGFYC